MLSRLFFLELVTLSAELVDFGVHPSKQEFRPLKLEDFLSLPSDLDAHVFDFPSDLVELWHGRPVSEFDGGAGPVCPKGTTRVFRKGPLDIFGATVSSRREMVPGRLWSLLEMLELKAKPFMVVAHLLGSLRECANNPGHVIFRVEPHHINDYLRAELETLRIEVEKFYPLGGSTLISIERFQKKLNDPITPPMMKEMLAELQGRFYDDLGATYLLSLNHMEQQLFNPPTPLFGGDVSAGFDSIKYEIDELGKCLALGRSTAAAFHAIRCLEGGITAISRCLGIPDPTRGIGRSWGNLLAAIKAEIDRRWPRGNRMHGDGQIFEELYAALAATQNPWRNATMHLDQKYTEQEAKDICDVVRVFMSRLAKRCDENGLPLA